MRLLTNVIDVKMSVTTTRIGDSYSVAVITTNF